MKLEIGDIVIVNNPLIEATRYPVTSINGNKAITGFRNFNRKIYNGKYVYEFGKRLSPVYNNTYIVEKNNKLIHPTNG